MAFENIRWNQLQAPDFSGVSRSNWTTANLLGNATDSLSNALGNFRLAQEDRASANILAAMQQFGNSADAQQAFMNGSALQGINPAHITAKGRGLAMGQISDLSGLETQALGRDQTRHNMSMDEKRFALEQQRAALANQMYRDGAKDRARKDRLDEMSLAMKENEFSEWNRGIDTAKQRRDIINKNLTDDQKLDATQRYVETYGVDHPTTMAMLSTLSPENQAKFDINAGRNIPSVTNDELDTMNTYANTQRVNAEAVNQQLISDTLSKLDSDNYTRSNNIVNGIEDLISKDKFDSNREKPITHYAEKEKVKKLIESQLLGENRDKALAQLNDNKLSLRDLSRYSFSKNNLSQKDKEALNQQIQSNLNSAWTPNSNPQDNILYDKEIFNQMLNMNQGEQNRYLNGEFAELFSKDNDESIEYNTDKQTKEALNMPLGRFNELYEKAKRDNPGLKRNTFGALIKKSVVDRGFYNPAKWFNGNLDEGKLQDSVKLLGEVSGGYEGVKTNYDNFQTRADTIINLQEQFNQVETASKALKDNRILPKVDREKAELEINKRRNYILMKLNEINKQLNN